MYSVLIKDGLAGQHGQTEEKPEDKKGLRVIFIRMNEETIGKGA